MAKFFLTFVSIFTLSSLALAENLECVSGDKEVKLDLTEESLIAASEEAADLEVGKVYVYSLSYKDINVRYGQVSSESGTYAKSFDHEASKFQIDGHTVLFLAESEAEILKYESVAPSEDEKAQGVVTKLKLKSGTIYFGRNINSPDQVQSSDVPAATLLCTSEFSD